MEKHEIEKRIEKDKEWFLRMEKDLVEAYDGEYIVIIDEKIIDHGRDIESLLKRVHDKFGPIPFFVPKVEKYSSYVLVSPRYLTVRDPRQVLKESA